MVAMALAAGCGGSTKPATPEPAARASRPVQPMKMMKSYDAVQPIEYDEPAAHADEPVVECADPPSQIQVARMPGEWVEDPAVEQRGWMSVDQLLFRKGCIPPTDLRAALEDREQALRDCFHEASTAQYFTAQIRLEWSWQYGVIDVDATAVRLRRDEYDAPEIDEAKLLPCVTQAVATVHVPTDADLPAIVDVAIERGFPVEGGVVGGVP
jgi:hypothetical protein